MPKIAIISDDYVWACGTGKYLNNVMNVLGDDCVGFRLVGTKKTVTNGRVTNIHPSLLEQNLQGVDQIWFSAMQNKNWEQVSEVLINHPARKLAIHNVEIIANSYMKCNKMYESDIKFDMMLVHRQAMARIFSEKFKSCRDIPWLQATICLTPEEESIYESISWEDKQRTVVSPNRWSSCKRSTQAFLTLAEAQKCGANVEMWGVKDKAYEMSQFHMLRSNEFIKEKWDNFVSTGAVKGSYDSAQRTEFLRRSLLSLDFMIIPGSISAANKFYTEDAHPQFVSLESVVHRSIPVMAEDTIGSQLSEGYYIVPVPTNKVKDFEQSPQKLGKWLADTVSNMTKEEWERRTEHNWNVLKRLNSWEKFSDTVTECRNLLMK